MAVSEGAARDNTEDWVLSEAARPRSFGELEARIDLALSVARSSETAVAEVGAAAIEAAEQARQAAELAGRAAVAAETAAAARVEPAAPRPATAEPVATAAAEPVTTAEPEPAPAAVRQQEEWLIRFNHRAERLSARLVRLQHC